MKLIAEIIVGSAWFDRVFGDTHGKDDRELPPEPPPSDAACDAMDSMLAASGDLP